MVFFGFGCLDLGFSGFGLVLVFLGLDLDWFGLDLVFVGFGLGYFRRDWISFVSDVKIGPHFTLSKN